MPRLDETFTHTDIIRIARNNITEWEYDRVVEALCEESEDDEEREKEKKDIKDIKNEIDITIDVDVDVGIWGWIVAAVSTLMDSDGEIRKKKEEESREALESFNDSVLVFVDNMEAYAPPHGRNRAAYFQRLEELKIQSEILSPCKSVSDEYIELRRKYLELKRLNDILMNNMRNFSDMVGDYLGF